MHRISVIDDDKDLLKIVKSSLYKKGFDVSTYFNWEVALKAFRLFRPQLILLDVFLSDTMDGLDVCQKLKSSPYTRNIPLILFSGFPKIGETAIRDYGADDFIAKPFELNDLTKKLYSLLSRKKVK
jgi:DNA-binding response OmpR family regulator